MYNKGGTFFTQNNNYIIFRTGSYYGVWDLWQNKLIYDDIKCSDRFIDRCGSKDFLYHLSHKQMAEFPAVDLYRPIQQYVCPKNHMPMHLFRSYILPEYHDWRDRRLYL